MKVVLAQDFKPIQWSGNSAGNYPRKSSYYKVLHIPVEAQKVITHKAQFGLLVREQKLDSVWYDVVADEPSVAHENQPPR